MGGKARSASAGAGGKNDKKEAKKFLESDAQLISKRCGIIHSSAYYSDYQKFWEEGVQLFIFYYKFCFRFTYSNVVALLVISNHGEYLAIVHIGVLLRLCHKDLEKIGEETNFKNKGKKSGLAFFLI